MISIRKTPVSLAKRTVVRHLPQTICEVTRVSDPAKTSALRILFSRDAAFDYFVVDGQWHRLDAPSSATSIGVSATAEPEAVTAVIASDIASWHRRIAYPLASDPHSFEPSEMERAESEDRITEAMTFLNRLSRETVDCAPRTIELADTLWNRVDDAMVDSLGEQKAEERASSGPGRSVEFAA